MPRNPSPALSPALPTASSAPSSPLAAPLALFARLRKLLSARTQTPAQLEEAIAELARAHAAASANAREKRSAHQRAVLDLLASADEHALEQSRAAAAAAGAHENELAAALESLGERLARARAAHAHEALAERWRHAQALLQARRNAVAELQARADAYARALEHAVQASEAVWAALPEHPPHRPATYGRDLYARAGAYLYGATDGKSTGPGIGGSAAHLARKRPDLVTLDAGAREILLLPLSAAQARAALEYAALPAQEVQESARAVHENAYERPDESDPQGPAAHAGDKQAGTNAEARNAARITARPAPQGAGGVANPQGPRPEAA